MTKWASIWKVCFLSFLFLALGNPASFFHLVIRNYIQQHLKFNEPSCMVKPLFGKILISQLINLTFHTNFFLKSRLYISMSEVLFLVGCNNLLFITDQFLFHNKLWWTSQIVLFHSFIAIYMWPSWGKNRQLGAIFALPFLWTHTVCYLMWHFEPFYLLVC